MPRSGPRPIYEHSKEFTLAAVHSSHVPEMQVRAVAPALGIHPSELSKRRKDVRDGTRSAFETQEALLQTEHDLQVGCHPVLRIQKAHDFALIHAERIMCGVTRICRRFGVPRSSYFAWAARQVRAHAVQAWRLLTEMRARFTGHHGRYGSPRLHAACSGGASS